MNHVATAARQTAHQFETRGPMKPLLLQAAQEIDALELALTPTRWPPPLQAAWGGAPTPELIEAFRRLLEAARRA